YEPEVLAAFDLLRPYSYKADLGKYCLLHTLGGWYLDVSLKVVAQLSVPDQVSMVLFRDIQRNSRTSWSVVCSFLYSRPGNPVFRTAIDFVLHNCSERYYGVTPLCPTGPTVLGRAVAAHRASETAL